MEDFLNQFKNNLEHRPEPDYEEKDWKDMENKLDRLGRTKPAFVWWWAALPLFLLLLLSNAAFYLEVKNANNKISLLEKQYSKVIHTSDTVFISKVIYQTDTVYQTRTIKQYIGGTPGNNIVPQKNSPIAVFDKSKNTLQTEELVFNDATKSTQIVENEIGQDLIEDNNSKKPFIGFSGEKIATLGIPYLLGGKKTFLYLPVENNVSEKKKTLRHYLHAMQPSRFHLGIVGGGARPHSKGLEQSESFTAGLEAVVGFNPHLQMWANASYARLRFTSSTMDDVIGIPAITPPTPDHTFVTAELPFNSLEYSIGMQYNFSDKKKINPFIGIGLGASSLLPYQISYDFIDSNDREIIVEKDMNSSGLMPGLLFFRAGVSYSFSKKWDLLLRTTYRHKMENPDHKSPNAFGLQVGLMYQF